MTETSPKAGLIFDPSGTFTAPLMTAVREAAVRCRADTRTNGNWTYHLIYSFTGNAFCGPVGTLAMDGGNLYGTTECDGAHGFGSVFKLTPSNGGWTLTDLHDFNGGSDGEYPWCNVVLT